VGPRSGREKVTRGCHCHLASRLVVDVDEATAMAG
jgi:hypothetical protein